MNAVNAILEYLKIILQFGIKKLDCLLISDYEIFAKLLA